MNIFIRKLIAAEQGATAIEYGLILALAMLGMMSGLSALASKSSENVKSSHNIVNDN